MGLHCKDVQFNPSLHQLLGGGTIHYTIHYTRAPRGTDAYLTSAVVVNIKVHAVSLALLINGKCLSEGRRLKLTTKLLSFST